MLVPQLDYKAPFNTTVHTDGTVKDAIRLEHGWWEAKDTDDVLDEEIDTYRFANYKEHVIGLLQRVCTVSVETIHIIHQMSDTVEHEGEA